MVNKECFRNSPLEGNTMRIREEESQRQTNGTKIAAVAYVVYRHFQTFSDSIAPSSH